MAQYQIAQDGVGQGTLEYIVAALKAEPAAARRDSAAFLEVLPILEEAFFK